MVTGGWRRQTHRRALIVFDQLRAALDHAPDRTAAEAFLDEPDNPYLGLLDDLYGEDYQLARLMDLSDLLVHAEGPDLREPMPALRATTWLCETSNKHLRNLAASTMELVTRTPVNILKRQINLRLTGIAPGSLYAGFRLLPSGDAGLLANAQDPVFEAARHAVRQLASVPGFIREDQLSSEIAEAIPDAAIRDASLTAAFHLAPTGKLGIHTLALSVPGDTPHELGQPERVVLREALQQPRLQGEKQGRFIGEVRLVNLDSARLHLRSPEFGVIRCVLPAVDRQSAKSLIGETVAISGRYEADEDNRPRLLLVDSLDAIDVLRQPEQISAFGP